MPRTRRPATAEEVQEFFETQPVETAELMIRLIGASIKRRQPATAATDIKAPRRAPKAKADPTPAPSVSA